MNVKDKVAAFAEEEGRRPRILVVKLGEVGRDHAAQMVASAFADAGFDVDLCPMYQAPAEIARQALENDVHAIGVTSTGADPKTMVPNLVDELKKLGGEHILVVVVGVVSPQDHQNFVEAGVTAIRVEAPKISEAAGEMIDLLRSRKG
jgi:methylmalonyl-CoA mutase